MNLGNYVHFADYFKLKSGLDLKCYKQTQMQRRIEQFITNHGYNSYFSFEQALDQSPELFTSFLSHLTINVSQFFRDLSQWEILKTRIIPDLSQGLRRLRIWSAGCSAGQEAYTLAIILQEYFPQLNYTILATDIDQSVLAQARIGAYRENDVSSALALTPSLIAKYFNKTANGYQVKDCLKRNLDFRQQNLLSGLFDNGFDLIICRNVVIYFTEETKCELYQRFAQALRTGGVLFTGSTEQIFNLNELKLKGVGPFFYQKL